jgi:hypothetical protein
MKLKTAIQVLKKDAEFMDITFEQILIFIHRNPYAVPQRVIEAFGVYQKQILREPNAEQTCMVNV